MGEYKFAGKWLFYVAGIICFLTIIFIPLGVFFIVAAHRATIVVGDEQVTYVLFRKNVISYKKLQQIRLKRHVEVRYKVGYIVPTFATITPVQLIMKDGKTFTFSLNYFRQPETLIRELQKKSGKKLIIPK